MLPPLQTDRRAFLSAGALLSLSANPTAETADRLRIRADEDDTLASDIAGIVERAMAGTEQPGAALALVRNGRILLARGWGVRKVGNPAPVTEATLFSVASVSKAFTAASLVTLEEQERLSLDAPVQTYLPHFALSNSEVSRQITVRDLLLHNSGLSLGAGDLMVWPYTTHTRPEIVAGLRHLPLTQPFRSNFAYDNVLYIAAGEVAAAVDGHPYEAVVQNRLFSPLGFQDAVALPSQAVQRDFAWSHARINGGRRGSGSLTSLSRAQQTSDSGIAAGGLSLSARDMAVWVQIQLARGLRGDRRIWSERSAEEMWRPRVIQRIGDGPSPDRPDRGVFTTYAMGWEVTDYRGRRMVWHGGNEPGITAAICLLPSMNLGFALMTNAEERVFSSSVRNQILDRLMGISDFDWLAYYTRREASRSDPPQPKPASFPLTAAPSHPLVAYTGSYRDPWYGLIEIEYREGGLWIDFTKTPDMKGPLVSQGGDTFHTRFPDRNIEDAQATFDLSAEGGATLRMERLSADADFSYDYQDLRLVRTS